MRPITTTAFSVFVSLVALSSLTMSLPSIACEMHAKEKGAEATKTATQDSAHKHCKHKKGCACNKMKSGQGEAKQESDGASDESKHDKQS